MQADSMSPSSRIRPWHILAAILLVGALLRFFRLDYQSFWYDETVSARFTAYPVIDVLLGQERDLGNPPLHYALLGVWSRLFGGSDAALRSLSATVSTLGILAIYDVTRRLSGVRVALVAAALLAISPPNIYYAQENRTYALAMVLAMASVASLLRAEQSPARPWPWIAYAASVLLCAYAHYFCFFFLAGHVVYVAWAHRHDRKFLLRWALAVAAAAAVFSIVWLPSFYAQVTAKGNLTRSASAWHLHFIGTPMVFSVGTTLVWKDSATPPRLAAAAAAVLSFGAAFLAGVVALRNHRRVLVLLGAWLLPTILIPFGISLLLSPLYNSRYVMIASPAFVILVAAGIVHLSRVPRAIATAGVVATSVASLLLYFTTTVKHDWRSAAAWLDQQTRPDDLLAFDVDTGEEPFARYSRKDAPRLRLVLPERGQTAAFVGTFNRLDPPRDVTSRVDAARRVWLVLSDPGDGSGGYYEDLLGKRFLPRSQQNFRGIEITEYVSAR
jgi:mannosyltransferase